MEKRVEEGYYTTLEAYEADIKLMLDNCRKYNKPETEYAKCAQRLETYVAARMRSLRRKLQHEGVLPADEGGAAGGGGGSA